ncbi:putative DNA polymerase III epsilon chain [Lachnospiraceae bacterium TWA4]|nr:putative DNA polymerase III epsilon chain [Lachnospiraceae bacterium TWA4]
MNYIVLDLEWNQCPSGKEHENPLLPFEIIELGAVKLNEKKEVLGEFSKLIRPKVYHRLHHRTKQVLKTDFKEYLKAPGFLEVIKDFFNWCGDEPYIMCTWGPMDLEELQQNMDFYKFNNPLPKPLYYYDIQKLFSLLYEDGKSRRALSYAVEFLHLDTNETFHQAIGDTRYTARIIQQMNMELVKEYESVDYHRPPSNKNEEIYMVFRRYAKYVSRVFDSKEAMLSDKTVTTTRCYQCGKALRKKIRWFPGGNNMYYSLSICPLHGYLKGKIRIKKTHDGKYFSVRTLKLVSESDAEIIRKKQESIQAKRKMKRKKQSE